MGNLWKRLLMGITKPHQTSLDIITSSSTLNTSFQLRTSASAADFVYSDI